MTTQVLCISEHELQRISFFVYCPLMKGLIVHGNYFFSFCTTRKKYENVHNNLELILISKYTKQATFLNVMFGEILEMRGLLN